MILTIVLDVLDRAGRSRAQRRLSELNNNNNTMAPVLYRDTGGETMFKNKEGRVSKRDRRRAQHLVDRARRDPDAAKKLLSDLFALARTRAKRPEHIEWVDFCRRFKRYSLYNRAFICIQSHLFLDHIPTFVATARQWREKYHRMPKEGAIPLAIYAPRFLRTGARPHVDPYADEERRPAYELSGFSLVPVYGLSQTEGEPLGPEKRECFKTTGYFKPVWLQRLEHFAAKAGVYIDRSKMRVVEGGFIAEIGTVLGVGADAEKERYEHRIELNRSLEPRQQFSILIHELAHLFLGHLGAQEALHIFDRSDRCRAVKELEAECVASLVCTYRSIDSFSERYLSLYHAELESEIGFNTVFYVANMLDKVTRDKWNHWERTTRSRRKRGSQLAILPEYSFCPTRFAVKSALQKS